MPRVCQCDGKVFTSGGHRDVRGAKTQCVICLEGDAAIVRPRKACSDPHYKARDDTSVQQAAQEVKSLIVLVHSVVTRLADRSRRDAHKLTVTSTFNVPLKFKGKEFDLQLRRRQTGATLQLILSDRIVADCAPDR